MLKDFISKFKNKQGIFQGFNNTYTAFDGFADDPTKRSFQKVSSTVKEQLDWFKKHTSEYFENVLSIEKTNSTGIKAKLVVDGEEWGEYSVLELLRLKSIMDGEMKVMLNELPVRDEKVHWIPTTNKDLYEGREIFETESVSNNAKTTLKRTIIVNDPHIKDNPNRPPVSQPIDEQVDIGTYTQQKFSGEISMLERAKLLVKYNKVYTAVIEALEEANSTQSVRSDLGDKFLNYMF